LSSRLQIDRFIRGDSSGGGIMLDRFLNSQAGSSVYGGSGAAACANQVPYGVFTQSDTIARCCTAGHTKIGSIFFV
jgi:hypothetical protein